MPAQRLVDGDAAVDGQQGGQVAHGVGGRAEADVPLGCGVRGAFGDGAGVTPVRGGAGRGDQGPVTGPGERPGVGGEFLVDGGPVRGGQAGGFAHEQGGAPFVELPGFQGGEGVRHFGDRGPWPGPGAGRPWRGIRAGPGRSARRPRRRASRPALRRRLVRGVGAVEGHGVPGLPGRDGGLQVLQVPDLVDQCGGAVRGREEGQDPGQVSERHRSCRCRSAGTVSGP